MCVWKATRTVAINALLSIPGLDMIFPSLELFTTFRYSVYLVALSLQKSPDVNEGFLLPTIKVHRFTGKETRSGILFFFLDDGK
jgi:hypothetical protein